MYETCKNVFKKRLKFSLTQLNVTDPDTLIGLFEDLLKVNTGKATGETCKQHSEQADYL